MPRQNEEWPVPIEETLKFGDCHAVEVQGLVEGPFVPVAPSPVVEVCVESPGAGIAAETHASRIVAPIPQKLRQHRQLGPDAPLCCSATTWELNTSRPLNIDVKPLVVGM